MTEGDTVILCMCGPVSDYGAARLAAISSISDGIALVEGRRYPVGDAEPWDIVDEPAPIRYILKPDTPDNRRFYGLASY